MGKTDDAMISGARPRPQRAFVLYPRLWLAALMLATGVHSPAAGASDNKNDSAVPFKLPSIPWLQKPAATPTPPPVTPAVAAAIARSPQRTRSQAGIVALFQKRVVNGGDLVDELRVIKQLSTQRRSESAALALMGRMNAPAAQKEQNGLGNITNELFKGSLDYSMSVIAYDALDRFIGQLLEDKGALQRKTIELPSPLGLTPDQQQQVITMAAIVVATQLTTDILEQAKKDFNSLEKDYTALLDRRGKVALLLADVLAERRKAREARDELKARQFDADLGVSFSEQDLAFLDRFPANISLKEFSNDFAAQNLALQFLRAKDPQAYADYRAQADDVTRRTKAYVRTMAGVAAFGALLVTFIDEASDIAGSKNPQLIAQTLPFGLTFVTQALPLVGLAAETTYQGVILEPKKSLFAPKRFNLLDNDQQIALKNASAVFGEWQKRKVDGVFSGALFRNESPGLLWRVSVCDAGEVGRMFDAVVPATQRTDFANRYFGEKQTDTYSFVNALVDDGAPKRRKLADELLLHDHRTSTTDTTHALSDVQKTVTSTFEKWNDAQLLRLIFANHEGPVAYAQMQVGTTLVRPVPSMQAVFEYESFVDSCSSKLDSSQKAAATRDL